MSLGGLGIFAVAIVDSSVIPLPLPGSTDLLLLLLTAHRGTTVVSAIWLAACAFLPGSHGGWLSHLERRPQRRRGHPRALCPQASPRPRHRLGRASRRLVRRPRRHSSPAHPAHPVPARRWSAQGPADALPRRLRKLPALTRYGPSSPGSASPTAATSSASGENTLAGWTSTILRIYASLVAAGILYGIWKFRRGSANRPSSKQPASEPA